MGELEKDAAKHVEHARGQGVRFIMAVGIDLKSSLRALALTREFPEVYASLGIHPHNAANWMEEDFRRLERLVEDEKVLAVGETGLDFYRDWAPRYKQEDLFRRTVRLSLDRGLPIVIHSRDAYRQTLKVLTEMEQFKIGGIWHCFGYGVEEMRELVELGYYISLTCAVTHPSKKTLHDVARQTPLDRLLIETDAPFIVPQKMRKAGEKMNRPGWVSEAFDAIRELRSISAEELSDALAENVHNALGVRVRNDEG
jgi:TatD DNase family protein